MTTHTSSKTRKPVDPRRITRHAQVPELAQFIPALITVLDPDGTIRFVNKVGAEWLGLESERPELHCEERLSATKQPLRLVRGILWPWHPRLPRLAYRRWARNDCARSTERPRQRG